MITFLVVAGGLTACGICALFDRHERAMRQDTSEVGK